MPLILQNACNFSTFLLILLIKVFLPCLKTLNSKPSAKNGLATFLKINIKKKFSLNIFQRMFLFVSETKRKTKASVTVWQKVAISGQILVLSSYSGERYVDHGKKHPGTRCNV